MPLRKVIQLYSCKTAYVLLLALTVKGHNVYTNVAEGNPFKEGGENIRYNNVFKRYENVFNNVYKGRKAPTQRPFNNVSREHIRHKNVFKRHDNNVFNNVYKGRDEPTQLPFNNVTNVYGDVNNVCNNVHHGSGITPRHHKHKQTTVTSPGRVNAKSPSREKGTGELALGLNAETVAFVLNAWMLSKPAYRKTSVVFTTALIILLASPVQAAGEVSVPQLHSANCRGLYIEIGMARGGMLEQLVVGPRWLCFPSTNLLL